MVEQNKKTIFVCHASSENLLVQEFREHLDPLFKRSELKVWEDSELRTGHDWHDAIQDNIKNAAAVIVLVSPGLLKSEYVREQELPALLSAAETQGIPIYPLFVKPSVVEGVRFEFQAKGRTNEKRLTDFQGLNTPDKPYSTYSRKEREAALPAWAKRVDADLNGESTLLTGVIDRDPKPGTATIYVVMERQVREAKYGKVVKKATTIAVHCTDNSKLRKGDTVQFKPSRAYSKTKTHLFVRRIGGNAGRSK